MTTNQPVSRKIDYISQDSHLIKHHNSFLAKSYKIHRPQSSSLSPNRKQKQNSLTKISKTINIFDKCNDELMLINQNMINNEESPKQSKLVQFGGNYIKMYQMVGPLALRRKILKFDNKNTKDKQLLDTNTSIGTKFNNSISNEISLKTKEKLNVVKNNTEVKNTNNNQAIKMTATQNLNQTGFNSTINRNSILSKKERDEQNAYTKDTRQINRYKQYKQQWERQSFNIKKKSNSLSLKIKKPHSAVHNINQITSSITHKYQSKPHKITLIDRAVKPLYIQKNRQQQDIINNNVTKYWQMSLRNHNKELLQYMRGTKYDGSQFQQLLQTSDGLKEVQRSIPTLDFRSKSELAVKEGQRLVLSGRKKYQLENQSTIEQRNRKNQFKNMEQTDLMKNYGVLKLNSIKKNENKSIIQAKKIISAQQEVLKINYDGRKHWLGTQGL